MKKPHLKSFVVGIGVSFLLATCLPKQQKQHTRLDGVKILGLEVALSHVRAISKDWPQSFDLSKYEVVFGEDMTYYFNVKLLPGEKPVLGSITKQGITFRVIVNEKTMKVDSVIADQ